MDFVNKAYAQLVELVRSMSAGTRVATVLLLVLTAVSLVYLFQYQMTAGDEFLLGGRPFTQSELTAIEAAFAKAGLGKSQIVGNRIRVPRGQKEVYLAALADGNALPADFYKYLDDAMAADSPFASSKSLEFRRNTAKQKALALIIRRMKGIEDASVMYDEEDRRGLIKQKQKTAMVSVQTAGGPLDEDQIKAIRNMIASAYAGLDRHNITITDMTSGFSYGGALGPGGVPEDESVYAAYKQRFEREWQRKLSEQFSYIPGVVVGVNVELNPDVQHTSHLIKYDPKPVTVVAQEFSKEASTQSPSVAGRPGAQSNGVSNTPIDIRQTATSSGAQSTTTESRSDIQNVPGHESTQMQQAPLVPKKVTASIDVPASYYTRVWQQNNPPADGQPPKPPDPAEIAKIESATKDRIKETVRNLLPDVAQGTNPYPHIVVSTYTDLPVQPPAPPSMSAAAGTWLADHWQTLAMIAVGLASLVFLRGMVRSGATGGPAPTVMPVAEGEPAQPRLAIHEPIEDENVPEPAKLLRKRFQSSGPDLRTELRDIVKENPDAAATILRAWIGETA
jgi:flagellar M-ring protein FliF